MLVKLNGVTGKLYLPTIVKWKWNRLYAIVRAELKPVFHLPAAGIMKCSRF